MLLDAVDAILTVLFKPLAVFGVKKCSKCYIRTRWAQLMLVITRPIRRIPPVGMKRVQWELRVEPDQQLRPIGLQEI